MESLHEEALWVELELREISFDRQRTIAVDYKGHSAGQGRLHLTVGDKLLVELKAVDTPARIHNAQVIFHLKATSLHLGLLVDFNVPLLRDGIRRIIWSR